MSEVVVEPGECPVCGVDWFPLDDGGFGCECEGEL